MRVYTFSWSRSIAAGAVFNPLAGDATTLGWDWETPDADGVLEVIDRATAVGLVRAIKSGGESTFQESPVQAGGTAGVIPAIQTTTPAAGKVFKGKRAAVAYRNPTGGAITVDGQCTLTMRGGR